MAKINSSSKIQEVKGFGITGYNVQFSVKDLYQLQYLANRVLDKSSDHSAEYELSSTILELFAKTIGYNDEISWDFLSDEEEGA